MHHKSLWEAIGGGPANNPNYDSRTGLGYGTQSGFHSHRQSQTSYPYREPVSDNEEDANEEDYDYEFGSEINKKLSTYKPSDALATKKSDPFYYFGAATRVESIVRNQTRGSMVPKPDLYKNRDSGLVGSNTWQTTKSILRTNSTPRGTQFASIILEPSDDQKEAPELFKLRQTIKAIFDEIESKK
jgi:hypothetical protein